MYDVSQLRAKLAERQIPRYKIASMVNVHPCRLGQMLNGKTPMPKEVADRLLRALEDEKLMVG